MKEHEIIDNENSLKASTESIMKALSLWKQKKFYLAEQELSSELPWYGILLSKQFLELVVSDPVSWTDFLSFVTMSAGRISRLPSESLLDRFLGKLEGEANRLFRDNKAKKAADLFGAICQYRYDNYTTLHTFKYLKRVNFELTSVCNLRCKYCTFRSAERKRFIDIEVYTKVLTEIAEKNPRLARLALYMSGESLLHPQFLDILEVTKHIKDTHSGFKPLTYLHTNGMLWTPEMNDKIMMTEALDQVVWSIDGIDKKSFEDMRPGAKFDTVMDNFEYFLNHRSTEVAAWVNNLVERDFQGHPRDQRMDRLFNLADKIMQSEPKVLNEPSFAESANEWIGPSSSFCDYIFHTVIVTTSGRMSLCCVDYNSLNAFGDLKQKSFEEIYFSENRRQILAKMASGRRADLPGCKNCQVLKSDWTMEALSRWNFRINCIKRLLEKLHEEDNIRSVALFGTGGHSVWFEENFSNWPIQVKAVLDYYPRTGIDIFGLRPTLASDFDPKTVDAIILSTDCFQEEMKARCRGLYGEGVCLIDLYEFDNLQLSETDCQ